MDDRKRLNATESHALLSLFAAKYFEKGRRIAVEGSLQTRSYDAQDGSKRYVTEVIAENVEF